MPDGSGFDLVGALNQGAAGQYVPPQQAAPAPAPAQAAPAAVPPPSSPQATTPTPAAPQSFDLLGAINAGSKGQFTPSVPVDTSAPNQPPAAGPPQAGLGMQALGGLATGATQIPNMLANLPIKGINALFGTKIPQFKTDNPLGISAPQTDAGADVNAAGQAMGSLAPMMMGGAAMEAAAPAGSAAAALGKLVKTVPKEAVVPVAIGGALGKQVQDTPEIPDNMKPIASMAANFLGAAGASAAMGLGGAAVGGAGKLASTALGLGKSETITDGLPEGMSVKATGAQQEAAVNRVRSAGGPRLQADLQSDPLQAAHSAISDKLDGTTPLEQGETPESLQGAQAAIRTAMAARGSQYESVPGSQPTTAQISPSLGMQALERSARLNPKGNFGAASFQAGDQAKNAAFVQHLESMNPGITSKLGDAFVEKATDLSNQMSTTTAHGQGVMQGITAPITSSTDPAVTGAAIREGGEAAHTAQRQSDTDLFWSQVPKDMQHSIAPTQDLAHVLAGSRQISIPNDASPELSQLAQKVSNFVINPNVENVHPVEQSILQKITALPPNLSYRDTATLLSSLASDKSQLAQAGLSGSRTMTRLSMIEGSLQDSMAGDFSNKLTEGAVPLMPPASAEGQEALNAARAQSGDTKQRFTQGAMGQVLAKGPYGTYKTPYLADVAKTVISGGASGPERMGQALDALRNDPQGTQALQDGLISDANRRGVIQSDGTVDLKKFPVWMKQQQGVVSQFPGLPQKFQNAAAMQGMVDDANGQAVQAVKDYGNGVAKKFLGGQDPQAAVNQALNAGDRGQTLMQIHNAVSSDPAAVSALQGHIVNGLISKFAPEGGAAAGADNAMLASKSFRTFVNNYKPGLRQIFGGQGMQNFDFVRAGLQQAQSAQTAIGGSQTTPLGLLAKLQGIGGSHGATGVGMGVAGLIGEHAAEMAGTHGLVGAAGGMAATAVIGALRSAAINNTQDMVGAMMRYPEFAKVMLQKLPPQATMTQALARRISDATRVVGNSYLTRGLATDAPQREQ